MSRVEKEGAKNRKTRIDKKRDVKPTISVDLKNCIYRLSYITRTPVKDVVEILCLKGLQSKKVIEHLSQFFRRDYSLNNTYYIGDFERNSIAGKIAQGKTDRVTTRFNQEDYERIRSLSEALDVTPSKATALLLDASVRNTNILNSFVKLYLHNHIDNNRMKELKMVLKYINNNNPHNEVVSWYSLFSLIYDDIKDTTLNVKGKINKWLEQYK